jgi:hypothetical protein
MQGGRGRQGKRKSRAAPGISGRCAKHFLLGLLRALRAFVVRRSHIGDLAWEGGIHHEGTKNTKEMQGGRGKQGKE